VPIVVGLAFYNNVLIPTGLVLLAVVAAVPLLRWGAGPARDRRRMMMWTTGAGLAAASVAFVLGVHSIVGLLVAALMTALISATLLTFSVDVVRSTGNSFPGRLKAVLRARRRSYGGLLVHLGFGCMAVGIAGSSLGSRETDISMNRGQTIEWEGRTIRYADLLERDLKQKLVVAARLEVTESNGTRYALLPAQHLFRPQNQWGTKVAIRSTFAGDVYVILHGGSEAKKIHLTLIDHPLIRWLWLGGWIGLLGVVIAAWPERRSADSSESTAGRALTHAVVPTPHLAAFTQRVRNN
jgi:cytochrome c-type biogenesis protein CcmF